MLNKLFTSLLFFATCAQAGFPPPTLQGQSDASSKTKAFVQVPNNQFTDLGGLKGLIETGNKNLLPNSSFEHTTFDTGWTTTTVTSAKETSTILDGKQSAKLTYSSQTGGISQSVTPTVQLGSTNLQASCFVNTSLSTIEVCGLESGSTTNCQAVPASGSWMLISANWVGAANGNSIGVKVDTTGSTTGNVFVDGCYVGPALSTLGTGTFTTPWVLDAGTWTYSAGFGTVSSNSNKVYTRRVGDTLEIQATATAGSTVASVASVAIPYTISSSKLSTETNIIGFFSGSTSGTASIWSNVSAALPFYDGSTTNTIYFSYNTASGSMQKMNANNFVTSSETFFWWARVPITQFTDQSYFRADATPASWSGYQDAVSGGCSTASATYADPSSCTSIATTTTTTRNLTCSQAASSAPGVTCTLPRSGRYRVAAHAIITDGSNTTMSARITDGSGTVIDPGNSHAIVGGSMYNVALGGVYNASAAGSTTFKIQLAVPGGTGSIEVGQATGTPAIQWDIVELDAPMPAPYLTGSVTSNDTTKGYHIEQAQVTVSNSAAAVVSQSGSWLSVANGAGVGLTTGTMTGFSVVPACICTVIGAASTSATHCIFTAEPTTTSLLISRNRAGAAENGDVNVICMGSR